MIYLPLQLWEGVSSLPSQRVSAGGLRLLHVIIDEPLRYCGLVFVCEDCSSDEEQWTAVSRLNRHAKCARERTDHCLMSYVHVSERWPMAKK